MVDIDVGNVYITSGTVNLNTITGGTTVRISTTKLDYNYDNQINLIPIVGSAGTRGDNRDNNQEPYARAIDLKNIKEAITVQGFLEDEISESAITKRDNLLTLGKTGDALRIVWGQSPYQTLWEPKDNPKDGTGIFINKMTFTETVGIIGESVSVNAQPERNIAVQLQVIRGKDL